MGRSQETFSKKEHEKKKIRKQKEKEERKAERKANNNKGKGFETMLAYVDENGMLSSTPPDPNKRKVINLEDIQLGARNREDADPRETIRRGVVSSFNESKGFGFIRDLDYPESIFFHVNGLINRVKEGDKVSFEVEMGHKGPNAVKVTLS